MKWKRIGRVENGIQDVHKHDWDQVVSRIILEPEYRGGLTGLEGFSHVEVLFHLHKGSFCVETDLLGKPRRRVENPLVGIFARRSNHRPNGIGLTVAKILEVGEDFLILQGLDAIHGSSVLDIKPYVPKVKPEDVVMPAWARSRD